MDTNTLISKPFTYSSDKYCVIYGHILDGLGDISTACKIAKWTTKQLNIPAEKVIIATNDHQKAEIINQKKFKILHYHEAENLFPLFLQIVVPTSASCVKYLLSKGIPTLCLIEYGFSSEAKYYQNYNWIACHALGINKKKGELGICINEGLKKWGFSPNSLNSSERLGYLYKVTPSLLSCIIGQLSAANFDALNRLYLGYVKSPMAALSFIKAILNLNQTDDKNLVMVLPGNTEHFFNTTLIDLKTSSYLKDFQRFEVVYYNHLDKTSTMLESITLNPIGKTLRIIKGNFYHADLKKILIASEKEMVVTGDQSLSEAISANKSWFYETRDHKRSFAVDLQSFSSHLIISNTGWTYDNHKALESIFLQRKANDYNLSTELNTKLIQFNLTNSLKEVVNKILSSPHETVLSVNADKKITPSDLPLGKIVKLNGEQISDLEISTATMMSEVKGFENSIFETEYFGTLPKAPKTKTDFSKDSFYLIKRMKKE